MQRATNAIATRDQLSIGRDSSTQVAIVIRTIAIEFDYQRFIGRALGPVQSMRAPSLSVRRLAQRP